MRYFLIIALIISTFNLQGQEECNSAIEFHLQELTTHKFLGKDSLIKVIHLTGDEFYQKSLEALPSKKVVSNSIVKNTDSLEHSIISQYPSIFRKGEQCVTLLKDTIQISDKGIKLRQVCNKAYKDTLRGGTTYSFVGQTNDHISIYETGYESWGYLNVSLLDHKNTFGTMGFPVFISDSFIFDIGNYYGAMEISFINLKSRTVSKGVREAQERSILIGENSIFIEYTTYDCRFSCHYLELQF